MLQEIARDVGKQVETMILKAKHASESKVSAEIQKLRVKMDAIKEKIRLVHQKVSALDANTEPILKADLQKSIDKLEEVWEGEVGTLKHELWQTIQAHNHNADLMKHHKEAIDQVQTRIQETAAAGPEMAQIQEQLAQVDRVMQREQAKQQQIDQFMQRLSQVQQQLTVGFSWGGVPLPNAQQALNLAALHQAQAAVGKKAAPKKPKAKATTGKAPSAASSATAMAAAQAAAAGLPPSMRAEAPEFVPGGERGARAPFDGSL